MHVHDGGLGVDLGILKQGDCQLDTAFPVISGEGVGDVEAQPNI